MRKTSFGLGLAGSILAFIIGFIMLIAAIALSAVNTVGFDTMDYMMDDMEFNIDGEDFTFDMDDEQFSFDFDDEDLSFSMDGDEFEFDMNNEFSGGMSSITDMFTRALGIWLWISVVALFISGTLGMIGCIISKRRRSVGAGVMLIIASILSAISLYGLHATALLIPSGIIAFIKDKHEKEEIIV